MTQLNRKVVRETKCTTYERGRHRPIIVTVYQNGLMGFRLKNLRKEYCLTVETAYLLAIKAELVGRERKTKKGK